jgi:hypothetical protein
MPNEVFANLAGDVNDVNGFYEEEVAKEVVEEVLGERIT